MADNLDSIEQGYAIKFMQKEGENCTSAYIRLRAVYGEQCCSRTQAFEWFKRFKCGLSNACCFLQKRHHGPCATVAKCIASDGDYIEK